MYCKDCKWWVTKFCENKEKIGEDLCSVAENVDCLNYEYNECGSFNTGPMFGCVHFCDRKDVL
jgi:hypothetical protein